MIKKEIGFLLINGVKDENIDSHMISVNKVDISSDLQQCKIFVSILSENFEKEIILDKLNSKIGFFKNKLCNRIKIRRVPEITFFLDNSFEKGSNVLRILEKLDKNMIDPNDENHNSK